MSKPYIPLKKSVSNSKPVSIKRWEVKKEEEATARRTSFSSYSPLTREAFSAAARRFR